VTALKASVIHTWYWFRFPKLSVATNQQKFWTRCYRFFKYIT
jgi:hypothetical protein